MIDCNIETLSNAIKQAFSSDFRDSCKNLNNIYGDGNASASDTIVGVLESVELSVVKKFIDMGK